MKYKLSDETKIFDGRTLYRIIACRDINNSYVSVKAGSKGGWVCGKKNLSQIGNCWIEKDAIVCDNAKVTNNALVTNEAIVSDNARIKGNAKVSGNAIVRDSASVMCKGEIRDHAIAEQNCSIMGIVNGCSVISGGVTVSPETSITTKHSFGKSIFNDSSYNCNFRGAPPICINDANYWQYSIIPITRDFYFTCEPSGFVELFLPEPFYKAIKSKPSICASSFKELWYKFLGLVRPLVGCFSLTNSRQNSPTSKSLI